MNYELSANRRELSANFEKTALLPHAFFYELCSVLVSVCAAGGMFLGFLFRGSPLGSMLAGGEPLMKGSLLGILVEVLRGSISLPAAGEGLFGLLPAILYFAVFFFAFSLFLSLLLTLIALAKRTAARKCCFFNALFVLLSYGILFLLPYLHSVAETGTLSRAAVDLPTLIVLLSVLGTLLVFAAVRRRGRVLVNFLLLTLSAFCAFALFCPDTELMEMLGACRPFSLSPASLLPPALCVCILLNLLSSALRLGAKSAYSFDAFRFSLQFALLAALTGYRFLTDGSFSFFTSQVLPLTLLILSSFAALLLSAFSAALRSVQRHAAPKKVPAMQ